MKPGRLLASSILLVSCRGGESGAPITTHQVTGSWSYEIPDMQNGQGGVCVITGSKIEFTQTGTDVGGTLLGAGGDLTCEFPDGFVYNSRFYDGNVSGRIDDDSIRFNFNGPAWRHAGAFVTPDSIVGNVNNIFVIRGEQYYWVGHFYSVRQP